MNRKLIIGTRGSALALWQANHVKDKLEEAGVTSELKIIKTQGDIIQHLRLDKLEGKGFFTKELELELNNGTIDLAVHSHKDLPTTHPPGLIIAAVSEREDPSELIIIHKDCVDLTKNLSLKHNASVGTSSNRRKAQLLSLRADLEFVDLRGNLQTRVQKLRDGQYDAIVLAKAGISRLDMNLEDFHIEEISPLKMIPAPAQGVLAIQIRESDTELSEVLHKINDPQVQEVINIERKVLNLFDAGCHAPLGCYCRKKDGQYEVWTSVADDNEDFPNRLFTRSESSQGLAQAIFDNFSKERTLAKSVFITREYDDKSYLGRFFSKHNITVDGRSLIKIYPIITTLNSFILKHVDWIFLGSKNAIDHFFRLEPVIMKKTKIAVLGQGSEQTLRNYNRVADFTGDEKGLSVDEFAQEFAKIANGTKVVIPCAKDSLGTIQKALSSDTNVITIPIYETVQQEEVDKTNAQVLIFTSPSNVEAYFQENLLEPDQKVIAIGNSTGRKFDEMGIKYTKPFSADEIGLAEAVYALNF